MIPKLVKIKIMLVHLQRCTSKIFFNQVKEIVKKSGLLWSIFKDEFLKFSSYHGEENDYEISQIEGHCRPSSNMHFQHFLQPPWKKYGKNESNWEQILTILEYLFLKFSSTMVKVIITKLVKLKVILVHLQRWIFKIFFNDGEGNSKEISRFEEPF